MNFNLLENILNKNQLTNDVVIIILTKLGLGKWIKMDFSEYPCLNKIMAGTKLWSAFISEIQRKTVIELNEYLTMYRDEKTFIIDLTNNIRILRTAVKLFNEFDDGKICDNLFSHVFGSGLIGLISSMNDYETLNKCQYTTSFDFVHNNYYSGRQIWENNFEMMQKDRELFMITKKIEDIQTMLLVTAFSKKVVDILPKNRMPEFINALNNIPGWIISKEQKKINEISNYYYSKI